MDRAVDCVSASRLSRDKSMLLASWAHEETGGLQERE